MADGGVLHLYVFIVYSLINGTEMRYSLSWLYDLSIQWDTFPRLVLIITYFKTLKSFTPMFYCTKMSSCKMCSLHFIILFDTVYAFNHYYGMCRVFHVCIITHPFCIFVDSILCLNAQTWVSMPVISLNISSFYVTRMLVISSH